MGMRLTLAARSCQTMMIVDDERPALQRTTVWTPVCVLTHSYLLHFDLSFYLVLRSKT